jgi:hypothetical protein
MLLDFVVVGRGFLKHFKFLKQHFEGVDGKKENGRKEGCLNNEQKY